MEKKQHIKRRQYLIAKKFQLKYAFLIVIFMFLIAWLAGYTVYYTAFGLLGDKLAKVYPQGRLVEIFKTVNIVLLVRIALLVPFVIIISIILSHRIAGPVYRMERYLSEVSEGNFSSILKLRRRDELKNLAEAINKMTQGLGGLASENQQIVTTLYSNLERLTNMIEQPAFDKDKASALAREAMEQISSLKNRFLQYRVTK